MKRLSLAALASAAMLSPAAPAWAADPVLKDVEAPANCEWRQARRKNATPSLYCRDDAGSMRYAFRPTGFDSATIPAAKAGDPAAMTVLGVFYLDGEKPRDPSAGRDWLTRAAEAGGVEAMFDLGLMAEKGKGGEKDEAAAAGWYRKGAAAGDGKAMVNLAQMLREGRGAPRDDAEALRLTKQAADLGLPEARANLGMMTREGVGAPADKAAALEIWRKAAADGSDASARRLGVAYADGDGVAPDNAEAIRWMRKGGDPSAKIAASIVRIRALIDSPASTLEKARNGDATAQVTLALQLLDGRERPRDPAAAAPLLAAAAAQQMPLAAYELGRLYADGDGVPKDEAKAVKLLRFGIEPFVRRPYDSFDQLRTPARKP